MIEIYDNGFLSKKSYINYFNIYLITTNLWGLKSVSFYEADKSVIMYFLPNNKARDRIEAYFWFIFLFCKFYFSSNNKLSLEFSSNICNYSISINNLKYLYELL